MKRIQVAKFARWLFHLHYDIRTEGGELLRDGRVHLILPNHPAYVEPPMLCAEFPDVIIRPMAGEAFFRKSVSGWALRLAGAILVPDLPATSADDSRTKSARVSSRTRIRVRTRACA